MRQIEHDSEQGTWSDQESALFKYTIRRTEEFHKADIDS